MKNSVKRKNLKGLSLAKQAGFTLLELVIVLSIIATLAGLSIMAYDGSRSQGIALYSQMTQYADAFKRMRMDTQCYPLNTGALFDYTLADDSHCGLDLQNNWKGPYAESTDLIDSDISLEQYAEGAVLVLPSQSSGLNNTSNRVQYAIVSNNIPSDIINVVMEECNNGYADDEQTEFKEGQCFILNSEASSDSAISGDPSRDYLTESDSTHAVGFVFDERR